MAKVEDIHNEFSKRLDKMHQEHTSRAAGTPSLERSEWKPADLPPPDLSQSGDFEEQMAAYNAWLDQRISHWRGLSSQAASAQKAPPSLENRVHKVVDSSFDGEKALEEADDLLFRNFEFEKYPRSRAFDGVPQICDRFEDFWACVVKGLELTRAEMGTLLTSPPVEVYALPSIYIPGKGCILNGETIKKQHPDAPASDPKNTAVLKQMIQAKWGKGFWLEYTQIGKAIQEHGLSPVLLGHECGLQLPRWKDALERLEIMEPYQALAGQGWQDWVWNYYLHHRPSGTNEPLEEEDVENVSTQILSLSVELLQRIIKTFSFGVGDLFFKVIDIYDLIKFIAVQMLRFPERADEFLRNLDVVIMEKKDSRFFVAAQWIRYRIGKQYYKVLEANLGSLCVPYALLIAYHLPSDLVLLSPAELRHAIQNQPRLNVNKRLMMLTQLDAKVGYNPHGLLIAARDRLKLDGPDAYFK
jgi:hypothetical protein